MIRQTPEPIRDGAILGGAAGLAGVPLVIVLAGLEGSGITITILAILTLFPGFALLGAWVGLVAFVASYVDRYLRL